MRASANVFFTVTNSNFNFDSHNIPFVSVVKYFYLKEFLQHIKAFSLKVVNW